ncbi:MAG: hypothetical protein WCG92_07675 [Hyphomicrobiales bacterium]
MKSRLEIIWIPSAAERARVDAGALLQRLEGLGSQINRVPILQLAVTATEWSANDVDNDC